LISKFIDVANLNGVDVKVFSDINFLKNFNLDITQDFDSNENCGFLFALSGICESASAMVNITDRNKLKKLLSCKNLYIIIKSVDIVNTMLEGYVKSKSKTTDEYILVISGESKTADIEKTLVSGVQGPEKIIFVILKEKIQTQF
jgi:L-lactate dehydrogenase complex protein LldG